MQHDGENNRERVGAWGSHPSSSEWQVPRLLEFSY